MTLNISNCTVQRKAFCRFNAGTAASRQESTLDIAPYHRPGQTRSFLPGDCCHFRYTWLFPRISPPRGRYFAKYQLKRKNVRIQFETLKQEARDLSIFLANCIGAPFSQVNTTTIHPKLKSLLLTNLWRDRKLGFTLAPGGASLLSTSSLSMQCVRPT